MVNVSFDMNFLFRRWVSVLAKKNEHFLATDDECKQLIQNVAMSIYYDVHLYKGHIENLIFFFDTNKASWRKFIQTEEDETFYKKDRNKIYRFDYDKFVGLMNWFRTHLSEKGICAMQVPHMEADDLLYIGTELLFKKGKSSVIVTADSDLRQLIKADGDKFIAIYNSFADKKIHYVVDYVKEGRHQEVITKEEIGSAGEDIFDMDIADIADVKSGKIITLINDNSEIIDPFEILLVKILSGDKNDSVPSCFYKYDKNGNASGFGEANAKNLYNSIKGNYQIDHDFVHRLENDETLRRELAFKVIALAKVKELDKVELISKNIKRNIKFVYLNESVYDEGVHDNVKKAIEDELMRTDLADVSAGFPLSIFDGTEYEIGEVGTRVYDSKERRY